MRVLKGDQPRAFEEIKDFFMSTRNMHILTGYAGTGKTFLLEEVIDYLHEERRSVLVTAPTNKAVRVVRRMTHDKTEYSTTHAALGMKESIDDNGNIVFINDPFLGHPAEAYSVIIIDEASMIDNTIFEELLELVVKGKQILFVGDPYQIPPVNHPYALPFDENVQSQYDIRVSVLDEIIRQAQGNPIIENANDIRTRIVDRVPILKRQTVKNEIGEIIFVPQAFGETMQQEILRMFKTVAYNMDSDFVKIIAWRNDTVNMFNMMVRNYLFGDGIPKIIAGDRLIADAPVVENRQVLISTNDEMEVLRVDVDQEDLGEGYYLTYYKAHVRVLGTQSVFNEFMLRIIHEDSQDTFDKVCQMQKNLAKSYPPGSYKARSAWMDYYAFIEHWHRVKHSYAITAHKSQGSTYHTAYVLQWDILANRDVFERNRVLYTACTRPSKNLYIEY